jgi:hypothetical protein
MSKNDEPADALEALAMQDDIIRDLYATWDQARRHLREGEDVDVRWEKGSAGKLLLQHVAVRESAKESLTGRLRKVGNDDLADRVEGDGPRRRRAIDLCDELIRGHQAITVNSPDIDAALSDLEEIVLSELDAEVNIVLPAARRSLGPAGHRGLPSARYVRTHSPTHPSPRPRWHDKVGPLKALRALYDHLRGSPAGLTAPGVDRGREQTPGVGPDH